jgi:dipeptidyl aminopeptidase/acylaminoacyl peptidase
MSDHDVLDRLSPYFPAPEDSLERFHRRRERKRRNQRIVSAAVALVLAAAVLLGLVRILGPAQKKVPAGTSTPSPGALPPAHTLPAPLAFSSGGRVYVMSPAGDVRRVAGGGEEQASFVSWADGGLIVRSALLKDPAHPCICMIGHQGIAPPHNVIRLNGFAPWDGASPSPDSSRLVFARNGKLYLKYGHGSQRLLSPGIGSEFREPVFSPHGSKIAFVGRDAGGIDQIYVMNANGTNLRRLTSAGSGGDANREPAWSPDGSMLVFTRYAGNSSSESDIYTMQANGSGIRRLIALPSSESRPSWSPDGSAIAFASDGEMDVVRPGGTGLRRIAYRGKAVIDSGPSFPPRPPG